MADIGRTPCPEGFHWIGQSFAWCDMCSLPAWEHAGCAQPRDDALPFSSLSNEDFWILEPWKPGEREACRRKWEPDLLPITRKR